jgi:ABC-type Fe3+-hydroxamate transport system substrate-binding protein
MYIIFWPAAGTLDRQNIRDDDADIIIARHAANNAADADQIYGTPMLSRLRARGRTRKLT